VRIPLPQLHHDQAGFEFLSNLWAQTEACFLDIIELDLSSAVWLDADMCAPFGALLYALGERVNTVRLLNIRPDVERALAQNGFLSIYGRNTVPDRWGTTLPYQRFDPKDDRYFADYVETKLIRRSELPAMSSALLKKLSESLFEIFGNAVIHSNTEMGIFSCGQFFPKRDRLNFSVADLGIGIRRNVTEHTGLSLNAAEAIEWATTGRNTTRSGAIPGGLGLKLLVQFIDLNGGSLQIISDTGYWRRENSRSRIALLTRPFPGTAVSVEINTADKQSYILSSEIAETDIF
jgi:hypothetical protein